MSEKSKNEINIYETKKLSNAAKNLIVFWELLSFFLD